MQSFESILKKIGEDFKKNIFFMIFGYLSESVFADPGIDFRPLVFTNHLFFVT